MGKKKITIPEPTSFCERINYTLNVCLYCWTIWESKVEAVANKVMFHVMRVFVLIFLPHKYLYKFYRNHINFLNIRNPDYIGGHRIVGMTCMGYEMFPAVALCSIICTFIGWHRVFEWEGGIGGIILFLFEMLIFVILEIRTTKNLFNEDFNRAYFKKFKKKDNEWLKKWKIYTILLLIGSLALIALSLGFTCLCISIDQEYLR